MTTLDDFWPPAEPVAVETPRKAHRHEWEYATRIGGPVVGPWYRGENYVQTRSGEFGEAGYVCFRHAEPVIRDEAKARRGKQSRNYGNRAELAVARKYGGEKIGHAGGPVDVRGEEFNTQVKTHRRLPPAEWRGAFQAMSANLERLPRLLLRFLPGPGLPPDDYFVIRADDWLRWYGKDEPS